MTKGYICSWARSKDPARPYNTDFWFSPDIAKAAYWLTRESAEADISIFERHNILIPSALGGVHRCGGFQVEERAPEEFVIFCEAPFIFGKEKKAKPVKQDVAIESHDDKRTMTQEERRKLQECVRGRHELRSENGWIHCLTEDLVIGPDT